MDHKLKLQNLGLRIANDLYQANLDSKRIYLKADRKIDGSWKLKFNFLEDEKEIEIEAFTCNPDEKREPTCRMCGKSVVYEKMDGMPPATCRDCLFKAWDMSEKEQSK